MQNPVTLEGGGNKHSNKGAMQICWHLPNVYFLNISIPPNGGPKEHWRKKLLSIVKLEQ